MTKVRWDGTTYEMTLEGHCDAPAATVYDVLADLSTHLTWAGEQQHRGFRLISLPDPGTASVGMTFTSTGSIPMTGATWDNRNEVVEARRPQVLEFRTHAVARWRSGKRTNARYEHRYEIEPDGTGSRVVYRLRETAIEDPPLRMRMPFARTMSYRVMIPWFCRRGFTNLLTLAARRSAPSRTEQTLR